MKKFNTGKIVFFVLIALATLPFILAGFWNFQPGNILEITNQPVPVRPETVHNEIYVSLIYDYCKHMDIKGKIETKLVSNKTTLGLPDIEESSTAACKKGVQVPQPIPPQTPLDTYHYHFKAIYVLNPLRTVTYEWDSASFVVKGSQSGGGSGEQGVQGIQGAPGVQGVQGTPGVQGQQGTPGT